ncbi:hypothetical protein LP419_04670 [Massilia sp. H-1]|nr:hypothetical protein LP419_04670 [Massilia sp. H-1]
MQDTAAMLAALHFKHFCGSCKPNDRIFPYPPGPACTGHGGLPGLARPRQPTTPPPTGLSAASAAWSRSIPTTARPTTHPASSRAKAPSASGAWNVNTDSRIGAQLGVKLDSRWSGVVQVIVEQRFDLSYRPLVEWANVKYQATPDLALRAAPHRDPDFPVRRLPQDRLCLSLGAHPGRGLWRRPGHQQRRGRPVVPLAARGRQACDPGLRGPHPRRADRHHQRQGARHCRPDPHGRIGPDHDAPVGLYGAHRYQYRAPAVRRLPPVRPGLSIAIADKYDVVDKRYTVLAAGINYDPGQWFLMAEGGTTNGHSFLARSRGLYVSSGYRAGDFTPYLSYSRVDARSPTTDPGLPLTGLPPPYAAAAAQLNGGLAVLLKSIPSQSSINAGVRWDFRPDMALKLPV